MVRVAKRGWDRHIARAFAGGWVLILSVAAVIVWIGQGSLGGRITKVERKVETRVEVCSTHISCRRELANLIDSVRPSDLAQLRRRLTSTSTAGIAHRPVSVPATPHPKARSTPRRPAPNLPPRPRARAEVPSGSVVVPASSTPPPAEAAAPMSPPVPTPSPAPGPEPKPSPPIEVSERQGPLGLPCVKALGAELVCHGE